MQCGNAPGNLPRVALTSVQLYLTAAYNRLQQTILKERCWFVLEEPGRLTLAFIDHGVWKAIKTRRRDIPSSMTLPDILDRETALLALEEPCPRVVLCSHTAPGEADSRAPYRIEYHTGVDYADRQLAMIVE